MYAHCLPSVCTAEKTNQIEPIGSEIYAGMRGMMLATGLVVRSWIAFPISIVVFGVGTYIRVSREEKLLCSEFGEQWDEYKRRVHAVLPGML
jgi:protein-S-isoprenylcysteine O-methyltransferase Ste14